MEIKAKHRDSPVHGYFGLSYASYLVVPRSALQSMPIDWQDRFIACMQELDATIDWMPDEGTYKVRLHEVVPTVDGESMKFGKMLPDPLEDYCRGRRRLPHKVK